MVKKISLLLGTILIIAGCDTTFRHLTMEKTPYDGDELRIDGYYYSEPMYDQYADHTHVNIVILYRDGFCINTNTEIPNNSDPSDNLELIENEVLLDDDWFNIAKATPSHIGVFKIDGSEITIENWNYPSSIATNLGDIVNDTTFIIDKAFNNGRELQYVCGDFKSMTYKFQEFSPKPDSTNTFVRAIVWE